MVSCEGAAHRQFDVIGMGPMCIERDECLVGEYVSRGAPIGEDNRIVA